MTPDTPTAIGGEGQDDLDGLDLRQMADAENAPPEVTPETLPIPAVLDTETNFLCGPAGTGKTWQTKAMVAQRKGVLLCATTGIAAVNLGRGATTINAALKYYDTASLVESYTRGALMATLGKLRKSGTERLVVDEVSMMDAKQLTILMQALRELAGKGYTRDVALADEMAAVMHEEGKDIQAEWPIKLTLVGDFAQLPPVKAPFAFESEEWAQIHANQHRLTKVHRQADPAFVGAIHAARQGNREAVIEYFRPYLETRLDDHFAGTTIFATNDAVERFNKLRLSELPGQRHHIASTRWGIAAPEWKNIPEVLELKVGALVMCLANERNEFGSMIYANGDLAEVTAIDPETGRTMVTLQRTGKTVEVLPVERSNVIPLEPGRVKQLKAEGLDHLIERDASERPRKEKVGGITYLPLRVAYASTVHKSQGLSLDQVQVNTREGMFTNPGMLYVALSRARTIQGLRLLGSVDGLAARCTVNAKVTPWL